MDDSDFGYDEGSDIDNWETEQVFQDNEGAEEADERYEEPEMAEDAYLDSAYEDMTCLGDE